VLFPVSVEEVCEDYEKLVRGVPACFERAGGWLYDGGEVS
jgi:hypothetical protein